MKTRILVVEDDNDIRRNMGKILESEGFEVALSENGKVALDYLTTTKDLPNLILLDLMMPVMDGFQFRTAQSEVSRIKDIPVIVVTADGHTEEKRVKAGAREALRKPVSIDSILDAIERVLSNAS